jgi:pimeloyl-ACP methyl ester carboxylesterase
VIDVPISQLEWIHTILVPATSPVGRSVFYLTHGFGGTALFYYELAARLREHGEVLLMDLRGMGHSSKYCPPISSSKEIITYFVEAIECVRQYFDHDGLTLVGHSFGSYVTMLYTSFHEKRVLRQVVFSPIGNYCCDLGITPKELDYKSHIRSLKDVFQYLLNQLGWRFKLTYKTLLKYFACCWKKAALKSSFRDFGPSESKA